MEKIAFVVNTTVNKYDRIIKDIERVFKGLDVKFFNSEYQGHIITLTDTAVSRGYTHIIAVGGDGTLNECINGITQAHKKGLSDSPESYDWEAIAKIKVGLLPVGTGNDFSKTAQINSNPEQLLSLIKGKKTQMIDVGWVSFLSKSEMPTHRFFANITDVGMGGVVVKNMDTKNSLLKGSWLYSYSIAKTFVTYEKSGVRAYNDHFSWEGKVMNFIIANGKYFGSGLGIAPDAQLNDGKLSLVVLGDISIWDYLANLSTVKKCKKLDHKQVFYFSEEQISIESSDGQALAIDMDGDFVGYAPMTIRSAKQKINFLM